MEKILEGLNSAQKEAVIQYKGPALVIAGAGSGKTRVLTFRIAYMLSQGIDPSKILALTFTNKAAREMKDRIAALIGPSMARQLWMGTFHSVFARILRAEASLLAYPADYTIYDTTDSKNLIKIIIKDLKLDEDKAYRPGEVLGRISMAKNNLITPEAYTSSTALMAGDQAQKRPRLHEIYNHYVGRCKRAGAMDFDDLLLNTNLLFRDHPEVLKKYEKAFSYILVDEYQDTNYSQYLIIRKLSRTHENLCVVGDDAQSIYSFRGARIENILNFQSDYPDVRIFKLEQNYRSTQTIVNAANSLIAKNRGQIPKKVFSEKESGKPVNVASLRTENDEGFHVAANIKDIALREQVPYRDFAILYRTNAQSRIFEESLRKMNIPYRVYGNVSFFQRKEVKDVLAYYRVIYNPADDESMRRIINYPARGIGKTTLSKIEATALLHEVPLWNVLTHKEFLTATFNRSTAGKLIEFTALIEGFMKKAPEMEAFDLAWSVVNISGISSELSQDKTPEGVSRYENLEQLMNGIRDFTEEEENKDANSLSDYLRTVTLYTDADNDKDTDSDKVTLMTVHAAKGLEFRKVFITGMEEDLFPGFMSLESEKDLEEERRLFYVAITRAEEDVFLSYAESRYKWGLLNHSRPSRFLSEIDPSCLNMPELQTNNREFGIEVETDKKSSSSQDHPLQKPEFRFKSPAESVKLKKISQLQHEPGRFQSSSPSEIMVGAEVEHPRFGKGKVIQKDGLPPNEKATVFFREHGQKQLLLKFAQLKVIK